MIPEVLVRPTACIVRRGQHLYCGRLDPGTEFVFVCAPLAAAHYDARSNPRAPIAACAACVDAWKKEQSP